MTLPHTAVTCMGFELVGSATVTCTQVDANSAIFSPAPPVWRRIGMGTCFLSCIVIMEETCSF